MASACFPDVDIFGSYPPDSYNPELVAKQIRLRKALAISGVCRYWRQIALGTGTFWSFTPTHLSGKAAQLTLERALVWLNCTQATPLDVCLDMALSSTPTSRAMLEKVIALPLYSKQIRTLYLSLSTTTYIWKSVEI